MLLPLIGAATGGYTAYQKSGGNLGATLLGAGLGAATPGVFRMAGTALGANLAGTGLAGRAGAGLMGGAANLSRIAANAPGTLQGGLAASAAAQAAKGARILSNPALANRFLPPALGGLAAAGGTLLLNAPGIAGNAAAGLAPAASRGAGGAANLAVSASQPGQAIYDAGAAVPQTPYRQTPYNSLAVADPSDAIGATRLNELLMQDVQLAGIRKLMPELFKSAEARSKTEFQRQMAAAGIRQNIATAANMLERSQQAAQQMGQTAAMQMGNALTNQYQYS